MLFKHDNDNKSIYEFKCSYTRDNNDVGYGNNE